MVECIRFINTWFKSNTYVLYYPQYENVWVIDPGDVQPIIQWMNDQRKRSVSGVFLTHAHFDHIYGVNHLLEHYPDCVVYTANEYGKLLLSDAKKNASYYSELGPIIINNLAKVSFYDDDMELWPGKKMNVLATPGHSDDSVCLLVDGKLFTGDTLIKDIRTVTKLKTGSVDKLRSSLGLLDTLRGEHLQVMAGHEECFSLDDYDLEIAIKKAWDYEN